MHEKGKFGRKFIEFQNKSQETNLSKMATARESNEKLKILSKNTDNSNE